MTTHKDTTMLERLARIAHEAIWRELDRVEPAASDQHERLREYSLGCARAILNELKHPSEGMIAAMLSKFEREHWNVEYRNGVLEQYREDFISAIDFVLNEGEGK